MKNPAEANNKHHPDDEKPNSQFIVKKDLGPLNQVRLENARCFRANLKIRQTQLSNSGMVRKLCCCSLIGKDHMTYPIYDSQ